MHEEEWREIGNEEFLKELRRRLDVGEYFGRMVWEEMREAYRLTMAAQSGTTGGEVTWP